jgi:hypothetical protein
MEQARVRWLNGRKFARVFVVSSDAAELYQTSEGDEVRPPALSTKGTRNETQFKDHSLAVHDDRSSSGS